MAEDVLATLVVEGNLKQMKLCSVHVDLCIQQDVFIGRKTAVP